MQNIDKMFEEFQIAEKAEKSIKEFSNWLFGISIGLCALIISLFDRIYNSNLVFIKPLFITILIINMLNVFLTGFTKYEIFKRETRMLISIGAIKKIALFNQFQNNSQSSRVELNKHFNDWAIEHNKLARINRYFDLSIKFNIATTVITGISVILIVI